MYSKVVGVNNYSMTFDTGHYLTSDHEQDCCEKHYLSFKDLEVDDFRGKEFDLSGDSFFERVPDFGIRLIPVGYGTPIPVPGYGINNGYYGTSLTLELSVNGETKQWNITECQDIND